MSSGVTKEELNSLKEAFSLYDTKKCGAIDHEHFAAILKSLDIESNDEKIKSIVNKVDKNHDGKIDFDEFVSAMTTLLTQPEELTRENSNDINRTREIQQKSHRRSYSRRLSSFGLDELRLCFDKFDQNGDGMISAEELKKVMNGLGEHLTEEEINEMMSDADTNHDGFIDFTEFKALMPSKQ